MYIYMYIYI